MNIRQAIKTDLNAVKNITYETIQTIYPHYYPKGAVDFFIQHHSDENIAADIEAGIVFIMEIDKTTIGTVTIKGIEICRLFILPQYQKNGYGRALLDFSEKQVSKSSKRIRLDASLPAKEIYIKRGYKEIESHSILTPNGHYLCYDIMEKNSILPSMMFNYDGKLELHEEWQWLNGDKSTGSSILVER